MREYTWKEAGEIEGISHILIRYLIRGESLFKLYGNNFSKDLPARILMKST
jgi:hypothetical protein